MIQLPLYQFGISLEEKIADGIKLLQEIESSALEYSPERKRLPDGIILDYEPARMGHMGGYCGVMVCRLSVFCWHVFLQDLFRRIIWKW